MYLVTYQSEDFSARENSDGGTTVTLSNGIICHYEALLTGGNRAAKITWKFNWEALKEQGIVGLSGQITVKSTYSSFKPFPVNIDLTEGSQTVHASVSTLDKLGTCRSNSFNYELFVLPISNGSRPHDAIFKPSGYNDAILVVEGKKLHVNKAFLSYHSEFFRALFSSNFKEGQMDEIPINGVGYEDLCLLLSIFHPNPVFPDDTTVEKLLEMADRFMVPSVTRIVEYHLLKLSNLENEKKIYLAETYRMPKLFREAIIAIDTTEKAKRLKASPEYQKLSGDTKLLLLDRLLT